MAKKTQRQHQSGNPARRAAGQPSASAVAAGPARSTPRSTLNRLSAPALLWMHRMPRWLVPLIMGLALALGLFLEGAFAWLGAVILAVVAALVGWLLALSWPVLTPVGRFARTLVVVALFGIAGLKATGRL